MTNLFSEEKKRTLFFLIICLSFYIIPILMADRYFIDDLGRSARGYYGGSSNGRPMADLVMFIIGLGGLNVDLSPLPMITAIIIFSLSAVYFSKTIKNDGSLCYAILLPLGIMENLSYKYDVLPMTMSVSAILIAYSGFKNKKINYACGVALSLFSLMCYQASIGLFVSFAVFEFISKSYNNSIEKKPLRECFFILLSRALQLITALIIYKLLISMFFPQDVSDYAKMHSEIISLNSEGYTVFINNFYNFSEIIFNYVSSMPDLIFYSMELLTLLSLILIIKKVCNLKSPLAILSSLLIIASPIIFYIFSIIHLLILKHPVLEPRVLISFSAITLMPFYLSAIHMRFKNFSKLLLLLFVAFSYTYIYAYGNALKSVKSYEDYVSMSISNDIKSIDPQARLLLQTSGFMDYPPQAMLTIEKYPSIKKLLPRYLNNNWSWAFHQLRKFGIKNNPAWISGDKVKDLKNMNSIVNRNDYEISSNKEVLLIRLKGKN